MPKILTGEHKTQRMASALNFLERYHKDGYEFLSQIVRVTGDEARVSFVNVETKEKSKQWMRTHSLKKPEKFKKCCLPSTKVMAVVFWDRKVVLMVKCMQYGTTVKSQVYCETLK
jgi:hypothetical protein